MATRLYFHAAASGQSGTLPSAEQSATYTETAHFDAQTVNKSMTTSAGTSVASLTRAPPATSAQTYYVTKFISPPIYQTSVAANTWVYGFGTSESSTSHNFPVSGNNAAVAIHIYVWRPSNGSYVGAIRDGTTAGTVDEGGTGNRFHVVNVTGSAVNNVQNGDVIIVEIWFQCTSSVTTGTIGWYYDGATDYAENATSATDPASYIETPETLVLTAPQNIEKVLTAETVTFTEPNPPARLRTHNVAKTLTTETLDIQQQSMTRLAAKSRAQTTETVSISEAPATARLVQKARPLTAELLSVVEGLDREATTSGPKSIEKALTTETLTTTEQSFARQANKWRKISRPL